MFNGTITGVNGDVAAVNLGTNEFTTECPTTDSVSVDSTVDVAIRYEDVHVSTSGLNVDNVYSGTVHQTIFRGDQVLYAVELDDGSDQIVRSTSAYNRDVQMIDRGDEVQIGWNRSDVMFFAR
ncbi:TOBE domain-containing protein [Natrialba swarupiae]|nr:TOBE domain-containing protein [Natrialba swarupiae]